MRGNDKRMARGGQRRTSGCLYLKLPYRKVNSEAERSAFLFEVIDGKLAERNSFARANFLVNSASEMVNTPMVKSNTQMCGCLPFDAHLEVLLLPL